ncbi:hypothetical protein [Fusibacter ferrireducens]|uniref:Uncharacterized protein n=1 Tax=Fusibacter ferrireducens TaxID=2785058 RepID=A0ABS0A007_9FIRM|nr:hypothetical protein [Fusibacter ferrireducens]MBF4696042.1 hypothetical protein [Fusibacter ferrireducens]
MFKKIINKIFSDKNHETQNECDELFIVVQLNDKIMPIDRGSRYEDPLDEFIRKKGYGEVTGGGTMQSNNKEIQFCDIEVRINQMSISNKILSEIIEKLEGWGAPKGSFIKSFNNDIIQFGKKEGIAVYLDGKNLPSNVYQECDSNYVIEEISRLIESEDDIYRYWEGEVETALYFYVDSYDEAHKKIQEFIKSYPLCQNARVIQIA